MSWLLRLRKPNQHFVKILCRPFFFTHPTPSLLTSTNSCLTRGGRGRPPFTSSNIFFLLCFGREPNQNGSRWKFFVALALKKAAFKRGIKTTSVSFLVSLYVYFVAVFILHQVLAGESCQCATTTSHLVKWEKMRESYQVDVLGGDGERS